MGYSKLFGDSPPAPKTNLFGESRQLAPTITDIEAWLASKGSVTTTANRINFVLNAMDVKVLKVADITDVGGHQVEEATEANKCVDQVVDDFAALKGALNSPRDHILRAAEMIEEATKPLGFLDKIKGKKASDWSQVSADVRTLVRDANDMMEGAVKYHLEPFIEGLGDAAYYIDKISNDLNDTINTLDYVYERCPDKMVQDLALRRKEMFAKSLALMQMNKGQVEQMTLFCEKQKHFATELSMTIKPLLENILRTALISDASGEASMKEIQTKLKAIL